LQPPTVRKEIEKKVAHFILYIPFFLSCPDGMLL
jgi:hypothetical protein